MKTLKNKAKKGFTIVELVIVIAVIAILAAVLIPTFTNVMESANESAAMQESKNEWTNYLVEIAADGEYTSNKYYVVYNGEYVFVVDNGEFNTDPETSTTTEYSTYYTANMASGYIKIQYSYVSSNSKVTIYAPTTTTDGIAEAAVVLVANESSKQVDEPYYVKVTVSGTAYYYIVKVSSTTDGDVTTYTYSATESTESVYSSYDGSYKLPSSGD